MGDNNQVLSHANELGKAFHKEMQGDGNSLPDGEKPASQRYKKTIRTFSESILALQEEIQNPPSGFSDVAHVLHQAGRIARQIHQLRTKNSDELLRLFPELNTLAADGCEVVKAARSLHRVDDPYRFLDEPTEKEPAKAANPKPLNMVCVKNSLDSARRVLSSLETNELTGEIVQGLWGTTSFLRRHQPSGDETTGNINNWMKASRTAKKAIVAVAIKLGIASEKFYEAVLDPESILWAEAITRTDQLNSKPQSSPSVSQATDSEHQESPSDVGFLGGDELRTSLQIAPGKSAAFEKALERARRTLKDTDWIENSDRKPNQPHYLYRRSAVESVARKYRNS